MYLDQIRNNILSCTDCKLSQTRIRAVPGSGAPDAKIFVVGEAPGYWEEQKGMPFVGRSGKYLTELFGSIGISRREMYIANTVNCRPPENRDPMIDELDACRHFVFDQLASIDPKVVVTVGRFSAKIFFPQGTITDLHGKARYDGDRLYMAMYHPAAAMHNPSLKKKIEDDFLKLGDIIKDSKILK